MTSLFIGGLSFGLAQGPMCATFCLSILLPVMLARGERSARSNFLGLGQFLAGRLAAYLLFGMVLGWLGARFGVEMPPFLGATAQAAIGLAMLLAAVGLVSGESRFCGFMHRAGGKPAFPALLGVLTGVNLCPPFVASLGDALHSGGPVHGMAYFAGFFLSTSLFVVPAALGGMVSFVRVARAVGTVACAAMGMALITSAALSLAWLPQTHAAAGTADAAPAETDATGMFQEALPGAETFEVSDTEHSFVMGFRRQDELDALVGLAFITTDIAPEMAQGFGGPVPALVGMDPQGKILSLKLLYNEESPEFFGRVNTPDFLKQFEGKQAAALRTGGVDAITGATVSARAVIGGVAAAAVVVMAEAGLAAPESAHDTVAADSATRAALRSLLSAGNVMLTLLMAAAVAGVLLSALAAERGGRRIGRLRWARYVTLALSVALLGFVWRQYLSARHFADFFRDGLGGMTAHGAHTAWSAAGFLSGTARYLPLILAVGAALLVGRAYCGWVCPFGALTELIGRLSPWRRTMPPRLDASLRRVKYALLIAVPPLAAVTAWPGIFGFEPFADVFLLRFARAAFPILGWAWLAALAIGALFFGRFFCKYICAVGAGLAFVSGRRLLRRTIESECRDCAACGVACPARPEGLTPGRLAAGECLSCGSCACCGRLRTLSNKE